jgi:hypothetical protein
MAKGALKITATDSSGQIHDRYTTPTSINGAFVGGTGGLTSNAGRQIQPQVYIAGGSSTAGSILAQKGRKSFRVTDGTNTGECSLVNGGTLAAGQMSIQINTAYLTNVTANAMVASGASTSAFVTGFTATGPVTPYVGQCITGLSTVTGTVTIAAVNSSSNITVSYSSQVFANVAGSTANVSAYASRISNRFVSDFGSDGVLSTNIGGGYNPNKYRYHLALPDSTFVMVAYA